MLHPLNSRTLLERCLRCKRLSPVVPEVVVVEKFLLLKLNLRTVVGIVPKDADQTAAE